MRISRPPLLTRTLPALPAPTKASPGHTETNEIVYEEVVDKNSIKNQHADLIEPEISLHALSGWSIPRTMQIKAQICHHELEVLIDSGFTHNFLSAKMTEMLQLPVIQTEPFVVRVANVSSLKCQGRFEHVRVILQGIPFTLTLYSLTLTGLDLVLRVQWLEQLGPVMCNWQKMTMEFQWEDQEHKLQGSNSQAI
ncbi:hypothetical protein Pint_29903 [Pistacia integerrima]|uniref:Uncharacterized protein n=1 Tax=Pistacia integerrima TaxID=434235 RepID=A0ACC0WZ53_9ROSI|nr:hypothetical protein Pint_29903 [Pistacia integerrima]